MNQIRECLPWLFGRQVELASTAGNLAFSPLTNTQPVAAQSSRINPTVGDMRDISLGPRVAWNAINPTSNTTYKSASACLSTYLYASGWAVKVSGVDNIPTVGQIIFAPNHSSNWDPVLTTLVLAQLGLCCDNALPFAAKQELFNIPGLSFVLTQIGQVPVNRDSTGSDDVIEKMQAKLKQGPAGFFPEGTRTLDGNLHRLKTGMIRAAIEGWLTDGYPSGRVQMIPVGIVGLAGPKPDWDTPRYCGRDVEIKFAVPKTIDQLVAEFKQKSAATLKIRFLDWGDEGGDVLKLLNELIAAKDPHAVLKETLLSEDSQKQTAAQKILLRWLAEDFAGILAEASGQNYVDNYGKARKEKINVVAAHPKVD